MGSFYKHVDPTRHECTAYLLAFWYHVLNLRGLWSVKREMFGLRRRQWERAGFLYDFSPNNHCFSAKWVSPHKRFLCSRRVPIFHIFHDWWERLMNFVWATLRRASCPPWIGALLNGLCETSPPGNSGNSADLCTGGEWHYQLGGFAAHAFLPSWKQVGLSFCGKVASFFWFP